MAKALLTYDVKSNHDAIKEALLKAGWQDSIEGLTEIDETLICHLPNTTLWHSNKTAINARKEFRALTPPSNIDRLICYEFISWGGVAGYHSGDEEEYSIEDTDDRFRKTR